jgi:hypothetical protein
MKDKKDTSTPETVSSDYVLMQVTLTLAVESYLCDEHHEMRDEAAIEAVLERLHTTSDSEIVVLGSKFSPLTLKADLS